MIEPKVMDDVTLVSDDIADSDGDYVTWKSSDWEEDIYLDLREVETLANLFGYTLVKKA